MGNLINTINHARKHMVKLADVDADQLNTEKSPTELAMEMAAPGDEANYTKPGEESLGYKAKGEYNRLKSRLMNNKEQLAYGAAGAAAAGGLAYLLARLLKRKRAWAYGLGGAVAGGAGGALGGAKVVDLVKHWLSDKHQRRSNQTAAKALQQLGETSGGRRIIKEKAISDAKANELGGKTMKDIEKENAAYEGMTPAEYSAMIQTSDNAVNRMNYNKLVDQPLDEIERNLIGNKSDFVTKPLDDFNIEAEVKPDPEYPTLGEYEERADKEQKEAWNKGQELPTDLSYSTRLLNKAKTMGRGSDK